MANLLKDNGIILEASGIHKSYERAEKLFFQEHAQAPHGHAGFFSLPREHADHQVL